jgi:anti-sigma factor (TIGR02949 family)
VGAHEINCEEALQRLFEFIDRELAGEEHDALERHLRLCRSCFSRVEFERQLKDKLRALGTDETPDSARGRIRALIQGF